MESNICNFLAAKGAAREALMCGVSSSTYANVIFIQTLLVKVNFSIHLLLLKLHPCTYPVYTGCPRKNFALFWRAIAPINFELGIKVGGVLESSGSQL